MPRLFRNRAGFNPLKRFGGFMGPFGLYGVYGEGPGMPLYRKRGVFGKILDRIPAPLKAFAAVTGLAALTVLMAPAIIILAGPPLICGAWWVHKQRKVLQSMSNQLHDQRWRDMASFHLQNKNWGRSGSSVESQRIPTAARIAVENAIEHNEQGIAEKLEVQTGHGTEGHPAVSFGDLQSLSQDIRLSTHGFTEKLSIYEYPLYVDGSADGIVRVISRGAPEAADSKLRVEVLTTDNSLFVLKAQDKNDDIIEGHGTRID